MTHNSKLMPLMILLALATLPEPAHAQIFEAPVSILEEIQAFITGPNGILLGGAAIALAAISAASPRVPVTWGHFFVIIVVLGIFFAAFNIAGSIQGFSG